jgi:hypothetical protein
MSDVITALKQGDNTVKIGSHEYDVWWIQEPGDDDEEQESFAQKTVMQLILRPVDFGQPLSFYGKTREVCLEHLRGYLGRRMAHVN